MNARDKLIEATVECLTEFGHESCSLKRIAGLAGVNHGLVHHYFGSKESLIVETVRAVERRLHPEIESMEASEAREHLTSLTFLEHGWFFRYITEVIALGGKMPAVAEALRNVFRRRISDIRRAMDVEDENAARAVLCFILGLALYQQVDPDANLAAIFDSAIKRYDNKRP